MLKLTNKDNAENRDIGIIEKKKGTWKRKERVHKIYVKKCIIQKSLV